jgi:hypothetical protein
MSDRNEDARAGERRGRSHDDVFQPNAGHGVAAQDVLYHGIPDEGDPLVVERTLLHDFRGPQFIPAVYHIYPGCKLSEKIRFFHRTVAASDDH